MEDLRHSDEITAEELGQRSYPERIGERLSLLIHPVL